VFRLDVTKVDLDVAYIYAMANTYVASVCSKCFFCFIRTLQVFHLDVEKVDLKVAYVKWLYTDVASVCSKCFLFQTYVASVSFRYCKSRSGFYICFRWG
jgi:hypothetical protein